MAEATPSLQADGAPLPSQSRSKPAGARQHDALDVLAEGARQRSVRRQQPPGWQAVAAVRVPRVQQHQHIGALAHTSSVMLNMLSSISTYGALAHTTLVTPCDTTHNTHSSCLQCWAASKRISLCAHIASHALCQTVTGRHRQAAGCRVPQLPCVHMLPAGPDNRPPLNTVPIPAQAQCLLAHGGRNWFSRRHGRLSNHFQIFKPAVLRFFYFSHQQRAQLAHRPFPCELSNPCSSAHSGSSRCSIHMHPKP